MKTRLYIAYGDEQPHLLSDDVIYYGYWDRGAIRCIVEGTPELVNANLPKRTLDDITNKVVEEISAYDFFPTWEDITEEARQAFLDEK